MSAMIDKLLEVAENQESDLYFSTPWFLLRVGGLAWRALGNNQAIRSRP